MAEKKEAKVCLLGTTAVGKTSLSVRFCQNMFYEQAAPTIGGSFLCKTMHIQGSTVKLQIWDTAGQERFRSLAPMYYRGASIALVVYDITKKSSFEHLKHWVDELKRNVQNDDIILALVGNKKDLEENREITVSEVEAYAKEVGAPHFLTSAKENDGINEVFLNVTKKFLEREVQPVLPPNFSLERIESPFRKQMAPEESTGCC